MSSFGFPLPGHTSSANHGVLASSYSYTLFVKRSYSEHIPSLRSYFWRGFSVACRLFRTNSPHCECVMAIGAIPHRMFLRLYLMWDIESISLGVDLKNRSWYWIPIIWCSFCMYYLAQVAKPGAQIACSEGWYMQTGFEFTFRLSFLHRSYLVGEKDSKGNETYQENLASALDFCLRLSKALMSFEQSCEKTNLNYYSELSWPPDTSVSRSCGTQKR